MGKYQLAIFDVDGTLLDTSEGIISSVKFTIKHYGLDMPCDKALNGFIGPPIQNSFEKHFGIKGSKLQDMATTFRNQYSKHDLLKARPYEGIYDALQMLLDNNVKVSIATYKREDYAKRLLNAFEFNKFANVIHGADHYNKLTKTDIIDMCIREEDIQNRDSIIMIGDTVHDAVGASNSAVDFLGVTFGFGLKTNDDRKKIDAIGYADSPMEIAKIII